MEGDNRLVQSLVDRLATKLPYRTGSEIDDVRVDELVVLTKETLVDSSKTSIDALVGALLPLLDDLYKQSKAPRTDGTYIWCSELYLIELLAECCSARREAAPLDAERNKSKKGSADDTSSVLSEATTVTQSGVHAKVDVFSVNGMSGESTSGLDPLNDAQARQLLEAVVRLASPLPTELPSSWLLDNVIQPANDALIHMQHEEQPEDQPASSLTTLNKASSTILGYISLSNWPVAFTYYQNVLRALSSSANPAGVNGLEATAEADEAYLLAALQVMIHFRVTSRQLSLVIQELCGCFLNLRKTAQNAIAILLPGTVARWIAANPAEFASLHSSNSKGIPGADVLFGMTSAINDDRTNRKGRVWPMQTALVLLSPEAFEVAGSMSTPKSSQVARKAAFLQGLRKGLDSKHNHHAAAFCLVWLCLEASRFSMNTVSALSSFALDVQAEVLEHTYNVWTKVEDSSHDLQLAIAAFAALARLDIDGAVRSIVENSLREDRPTPVKVAVIGACANLASQEDSDRFQVVFSAVAPFIRRQLHSYQTEAEKESRETIPRPARQAPQSPVNPATDLILAILRLLSIRPSVLYAEPHGDAGFEALIEDMLAVFITLAVGEDERLRSWAGSVARHLAGNKEILALERKRLPSFAVFVSKRWKSSAHVISTISDRLLAFEFEDPGLLKMIIFFEDYLKIRLKGLKSAQAMDYRVVNEVALATTERNHAAAALEVAVLILLCSSNLRICALMTSCLDLYCEAGSSVATADDYSQSPLTIMRNYDAYSELASQDFHLTGSVAFQKRFRKFLMKMSRPTAGLLTAWETVFVRWRLACQEVVASQSEVSSSEDENAFSKWRNYSGFLAALGGICISETTHSTRYDPTIAGLRWIDRPASDSEGESLLDQFINHSLQMLTCVHVRVREAMREILGTELHLRLYPQLFHALQADLNLIFENTYGVTKPTELDLICVEQAIALIRLVVDRVDEFHETFFSIDLGSSLLHLAQHLQLLANDNTILRVKIRFCQLCEVVALKRELLNFRYDVRIRNQIVEILLGWISPKSTMKGDSSAQAGRTRQDEGQRLRLELDRACLKTLAEVTYRLPLQPLDGPNDAESNEGRSQLFQSLFRKLLSMLREDFTDLNGRKFHSPSFPREEPSSISELSISVLSNILSANIDIGLKQSLEAGYHDDIEIRTAFVRVLYNILDQGTEFGNLSDSAINEKYGQMLELILGDINLLVAICNACPSGEVDEVTVSLLNIFDSRGRGFNLLEALIEQEVANTENESELLRRNCVATKMLSLYAKWKGSGYLKSTLQELLERLVSTSEDLDLELDPARITSPEELQRNTLQLRRVTKVFVDDIVNSADQVPVAFRRICHSITTAVATHFPEAKFTAVGAFVFLRFFCPAIVAPDSEGLISTTLSKEMRRGLLLIAKIIQNLANNVLFGVKEPYMLPLNDFLTQNIYRVTAFLRDISNPPRTPETTTLTESFDFGSCVSLHSFFYNHWDTVRRKMILRNRRPLSSAIVLNGEMNGKKSSLEQINELVSTLGPPPQDVSWTVPQISANIPPAYSRFQHFMLKNAGKNVQSIISARAVYDGGESKDSLPVICIILRNIEIECMNYDLLLYCYLKIASKMWHRPFGVLIDATCYNNLNEPPDELFKKLDSLTPSEMSKRLTRVYIYNMNSTFRKCFRRVIRLAARNERSSFHPKNISYYLIGSLQDLQIHFHLGSLHLPKDTISVVTDSRYVFQPVTRLSKTKGKVDVITKIGSQFIQITTSQKQEIVAGHRLSATVNDIFRLSDIEEANSSSQFDDEHAYGFRTENGKVVMYFSSPRKQEVLQAIRSAKLKHSTEAKPPRLTERLVRPEDIPGTLLNISLRNMAHSEQHLRVASYNLLCGLCRAFRFSVDKSFISNKDLAIPVDSAPLIVSISKRLAVAEPQLTHDFLLEFFAGWQKCPANQRLLNIMFMVPWLPNMWTYVLSNEKDSDRGMQKVAMIAKKLADLTLLEPDVRTWFQEEVWPTIANSDVMIEVLLEYLIRLAQVAGPDSEKAGVVYAVVGSLDSILARGKIVSRLRKALNKSSLRPTKHLVDNAVWTEVSVLLNLCVAMSFDSRVQVQLFLPELFHCITLMSQSGTLATRATLVSLTTNITHAICTTLPLEEGSLAKVKSILARLGDAKSMAPLSSREAGLQSTESQSLTLLEHTVATLLEIMTNGAPTIEIANAWRSRWMSLVASTAFQSNPAMQTRAFVVMGFLIKDEVDDDLLYQILVALRGCVSRLVKEKEPDMLLAIVGTLGKISGNLAPTSRYLLQLFWLAMSIMRLCPPVLYRASASLLEASLLAISTSSMIKSRRMVSVLWQGRFPIEDALIEIDELCGITFTQETFHIASSACIIKGLTDAVTMSTALRVLSSFLEIGSTTAVEGARFPKDLSLLPYLSVVVARATSAEESREILWLAGVTPPAGETTFADVFEMIDIDNLRDREILLNAALSIVDFKLCDHEVQQRTLYFLDRIALTRPRVMIHLYDLVSSMLDNVLRNTQSSNTLKAAHKLTRSLAANPLYAASSKSVHDLDDVLEEMGFGGLWRSSTFEGQMDMNRCGETLDRLIEMIIA